MRYFTIARWPKAAAWKTGLGGVSWVEKMVMNACMTHNTTTCSCITDFSPLIWWEVKSLNKQIKQINVAWVCCCKEVCTFILYKREVQVEGILQRNADHCNHHLTFLATGIMPHSSIIQWTSSSLPLLTAALSRLVPSYKNFQFINSPNCKLMQKWKITSFMQSRSIRCMHSSA